MLKIYKKNTKKLSILINFYKFDNKMNLKSKSLFLRRRQYFDFFYFFKIYRMDFIFDNNCLLDKKSLIILLFNLLYRKNLISYICYGIR